MADYISHKLLGVIKKHQRPKDFTAPEFHDLHHSLADFLKMGLQRLLSQIQDPLATGKMWAQPPSSTIWLSGPVLVCAPAKKAIDQLIRKSHWPGSKSSSSPSGSSTPHCTPWPYTTKSGTLVACQSSRCWRTRPRSCHLQTRNSGTEPWSIRQEETCSQTGAHKHMPSAAHVDDRPAKMQFHGHPGYWALECMVPVSSDPSSWSLWVTTASWASRWCARRQPRLGCPRHSLSTWWCYATVPSASSASRSRIRWTPHSAPSCPTSAAKTCQNRAAHVKMFCVTQGQENIRSVTSYQTSQKLQT